MSVDSLQLLFYSSPFLKEPITLAFLDYPAHTAYTVSIKQTLPFKTKQKNKNSVFVLLNLLK